jgi:hypothetical protein
MFRLYSVIIRYIICTKVLNRVCFMKPSLLKPFKSSKYIQALPTFLWAVFWFLVGGILQLLRCFGACLYCVVLAVPVWSCTYGAHDTERPAHHSTDTDKNNAISTWKNCALLSGTTSLEMTNTKHIFLSEKLLWQNYWFFAITQIGHGYLRKNNA